MVKENLKLTSKGSEIITQFYTLLLPDMYKSLEKMVMINHLPCSSH